MKKLILLALSILSLIGCAAQTDAATETASVASPLFGCENPSGTFVIRTSPFTDALRAQVLTDKMFGNFPLKGTCATPGSCGTSMPATCSASQCDAGQCPGWTCHYWDMAFAPDNLRIGALVGGPPALEVAYAAEPGVKLTLGEKLELTAFRVLATVFDFQCDLF